MSSPNSSTTNLLSGSSRASASNKDFSTAFATLQSTYGFAGSPPVIPSRSTGSNSESSEKHDSKKRTYSQSPSRESPASVGKKNDKDYNQSFAQMQASYGFGSGAAPTPAMRPTT